MRQTVSTVIEHTTKEVLEERARIEGIPLSRYIRQVLEAHERAPFKSKQQQLEELEASFRDD